MVVQHNLRAMNSNRMLGITSGVLAKSSEKLSSGYKINRAADDAAGLSISEKMRKQIRGLTQASLNAEDGISAVQTAEGALTEVHDMLQRMNELAVKASNGTMSESDRQSVQDEIDQLVTEIDRVSETTKFNETYLLRGEGTGKNAGAASAKVDGKIQDAKIIAGRGNIFAGTIDSTAANVLDAGTEDTATITYLDENGDKKSRDVVFKAGKDAAATAANLAEAINNDDVLKGIFKASADKSGKLSVESREDGNKTDDTKNAVKTMTFKSASGTGVARKTAFDASGTSTTKAVGESYSFSIGGFSGASTAGTAVTLAVAGAGNGVLTNGESVTINGKTYTYDSGKTSGIEANTFKTLDDLNKLLEAEGYKANVVVTATKVDKAYNTGDEITGITKSDYSKAILSTKTNTNGLGALVAADFEATASDFLKGADHTTGKADTKTNYENIKVELRVTQIGTVDQAKDVLSFSLQVGADTTQENKIAVDIQSMSAKSLGINRVSVTGKDSTNADKAVNTIADAIAQVSKQRSALGAIQNRLEHTIKNLDNVVENTTAAESTIRDTDMATEMVKFANSNILAQAGQSMLAQSNQANQGVLSLLG